MPKDQKRITIENATLIFRNFAGEKSMYNAEGERNFCVLLSDDDIPGLEALGFNIKRTRERDDGEGNDPYLAVKVNYAFKPPRVVVLTTTSRTALKESQLGVLDYADIEKADLVVNGSDWDVNGKQGTSAYLKSLFVTIEEDELERKYAINEFPAEVN